jgi:hypothetical protein
MIEPMRANHRAVFQQQVDVGSARRNQPIEACGSTLRFIRTELPEIPRGSKRYPLSLIQTVWQQEDLMGRLGVSPQTIESRSQARGFRLNEDANRDFQVEPVARRERRRALP